MPSGQYEVGGDSRATAKVGVAATDVVHDEREPRKATRSSILAANDVCVNTPGDLAQAVVRGMPPNRGRATSCQRITRRRGSADGGGHEKHD